MKYRMSHPTQNKAARNRLYYLARKKSLVEIKEIRPKRTLAQNSYLHLIISYFGLHFGYTLEEAKQLYKEINKDIYFYKKKKRTFMRSSADLNTAEMANSIDLFMEKSNEAGCPLPLATDQDWLLEIDNELERSHYR